MSRRAGALILLAAALAILAWGCGGDGGRFLIEEESPTPTGTPAIFQRSPVARASPSPSGSPTASPTVTGSPEASPTAAQTPAAEANVTPEATPFEITVKDAVNIRERPSTAEDSAILGGIFPGEKARVIGQALGQDIGMGNLWYQVEKTMGEQVIRGFVYAPLAEKVE